MAGNGRKRVRAKERLNLGMMPGFLTLSLIQLAVLYIAGFHGIFQRLHDTP